MDKLTQLNAFVKVVDVNSFTLAAEELGVANGTVSKWVNNLESTIGCQLLIRKGNSLSLTNKGNIFYQQTLEVLGSYRKLLNSILQDQAKGCIKLCLPRSFGETVLFPILLDFCEQYPDIQLDIQMTDEKQSIYKLGFDLVMRIGDVSEQDVVARELGNIQNILVASASLINTNKLSDISYISQLPVILHNECQYTNLEKILYKKSQDSHVTMRLNSSSCVIQALQRQLSLSVLPLYQIKKLLDKRKLVRLLPNIQLPCSPLNIIYPNRDLITPQTRLLISHIIKKITEANGF